MDISLDVGNLDIPVDRVIEQLDRFKLLPQLIREIIADDLIGEMFIDAGVKLADTVDLQQRALRLGEFKVAKWGDEVEAYFQAHRLEFDRVLLSIIQAQDADLVQELFFRIEAGEKSFTELAIDYSQGIHAENGGIWGPLFWLDLSPEIKAVLAELAEGDLSSVFQFDGYHTLIRFDRYEPACLDDLRYNFILDRLFSTWFEPQLSHRFAAIMPTDKAQTNGWKAHDWLAKFSLQPSQIIDRLNQSPLLPKYLRAVVIEDTLKSWIESPEFAAIRHKINPKLLQQNRQENLFKVYKHSRFNTLVKSRFLERKSQLDRVLFSTIQVKELRLSQELHYRLTEQEQSFTQVAIRYSDSPAAPGGGLIGPISISQLYPQIQAYLRALQPHQLSPIFQVDEYYVFLRLDRWLPVQLNPQIEQRLLDEIFEEWLQKQMLDQAGKFQAITSNSGLIISDQSGLLSSQLAMTQGFNFTDRFEDTITPVFSIFFPQVSAGGQILPPKILARKNLSNKYSFFMP